MSQPSDENMPVPENTPAPENAPTTTRTHKNCILRLYYGEYSLPVTFWVWGALIPAVLHLVVYCVGYILFVEPSPVSDYVLKALGPPKLIKILIWVYTFASVYTAIVLVGEWRAAKKFKGLQLWAVLVRIGVILVVAYSIYTLPDVISMFRRLLELSTYYQR